LQLVSGRPHGRGVADYDGYEKIKTPWKRGDGSSRSFGNRSVILWEDIADIQPTDRLVKHLIGTGSLVVLAGASGSGKTYLALDLALHVSLGRSWFGHLVQKAGVVYVAAEGQLGLCNRIAAFRHNLGREDDVPFGLLPGVLDLLGSDDPNHLIEEVKLVNEQLTAKVGLIVVDTLA
jgi:RecA-family ATPase